MLDKPFATPRPLIVIHSTDMSHVATADGRGTCYVGSFVLTMLLNIKCYEVANGDNYELWETDGLVRTSLINYITLRAPGRI